MAIASNTTLAFSPTVLDLPSDWAGLTFDEISRNNGDVIRTDVSRSLSLPRLLIVKHTLASANAKGPKVDRHLISLTSTDNDSTGSPLLATVNLSIVAPRGNGFVAADYIRLITANVLFVENNMAAILRGES